MATLLTNAYYLRWLEPAVSRKLLGVLSVLLGAVPFLRDVYGLPRPREVMRRIFIEHRVVAALLAILALAAGLRLWGVSYGLPQSYVADEYDFVHSYLQMLKRGDFNPHWWIHPSLQAYVNIVTYLLVFLVNVPTGRWHTVHQLTVEDVLFWGRFSTGVVPGVLTVLVTFFLAKRMFGARAGLFSAALVAVFPAAVEVSQYNKPDPLLTLMAPLSVLVSVVYFDRGGRKLAFASGIMVGLAAAAKYNGGFVVLTFVIAAFLRLRGRVLTSPDLYLGALGSVTGFVMGCPYFFSELPESINQVADALYNYGYGGWPGAEGTDNWFGHAKYAAAIGAGPVAFFAALLGLAVCLYRLDARLAVFLSFPVLYYSYYSSQRMVFTGNIVCVYPFIAALAALAVETVAKYLGRAPVLFRGRGLRWAGVAALVLAMLAFPVAGTIAHNRERTLLDTGTFANVWIESHFQPGTHFAVERQTPVLDPDRYEITVQSRIIDRAVRDYRAEGVEYLVVSSALYERFGPEQRQTINYQKLFRICPLVAEFEPLPGQRIGPTIRILRVPGEEPPSSAPDP